MNMTSGSLNEWAEAVREAYIVNGMHPSDMVEEIARANGLNPDQIKRLCESSNMSIKNHMRKGKVDDVMFPLASSHEVIARLQPGEEDEMQEMETNASLAPVSRLREFTRSYLTGASRGIVKKAAYEGDPVKAAATMMNELTKRANDRRHELYLAKRETEKVAQQIVDYLSDEARLDRNVNASFTAVKMCLPDNPTVDPMYKNAHKLICEGLRYPYPEPQMIKAANRTPNPESTIVGLFSKYAALMSDMNAKQKSYDSIEKQKTEAAVTLRELIARGV